MPLNQRQVIAEAIDTVAGKIVVEFGCGGTTKWLLENTLADRITTIDNDRKWLEKCVADIEPFWRTVGKWRPRFAPVKVGQNATTGEEQHVDDAPHWSSAEAYADECLAEMHASVFLIDGVLRAKCLRHVVNYHNNREHCTIFLHDTQRDWYDEAIQEAIDAGFERTDYPEGDDYPGCLLTKLEKQ